VNAEYLEGNRDQPIDKRRFLQIGYTVQPRGHPVARLQHVARNLRLHRINIVLQGGRAEDRAQKDHGPENQDRQLTASASEYAMAGLIGACTFHLFIQVTSVNIPHN